ALGARAPRPAAPGAASPPRLAAPRVVRQPRAAAGAALALLRPRPRRPSPAATRGTAFHAWLESRYGDPALLDLEDLTALAETAGTDQTDQEDPADLDAAALREAFEASTWAARTPIAVEHP